MRYLAILGVAYLAFIAAAFLADIMAGLVFIGLGLAGLLAAAYLVRANRRLVRGRGRR